MTPCGSSLPKDPSLTLLVHLSSLPFEPCQPHGSLSQKPSPSPQNIYLGLVFLTTSANGGTLSAREKPKEPADEESRDSDGGGDENNSRSTPWKAEGRAALACLADARDSSAVDVEGLNSECERTASTAGLLIMGEYGPCVAVSRDIYKP